MVKPVEVVAGIALSLPEKTDRQNLWDAAYVNRSRPDPPLHKRSIWQHERT